MWKRFLSSSENFYDSKVGLIFQSLFMNFMLRPYYKLFFKMEVQGKENIPRDNRLIFASSHASYHDPPLLAAATRMHMAYMAKKELFEVPVLSQLISGLGAFPVNRQKLEIKTIKTAKRILSSKRWNLGIFPQGTRIMDGTLGEVKAGFGHLAKVTKSPVIPVYIDLKRGKYPFYGKIVVKIGKQLPHSDNVDEIQENWKKALSELSGKDFTKAETTDGKESATVLL